MTTKTGISPLYLEIGKQLALGLAASYAQINPGAAAALTLVNTIMAQQAAIAKHNTIIVQAQTEKWSDTDPRWDAVLKEQQSRMDAINARHDAQM